jgi:hypothetical protein
MVSLARVSLSFLGSAKVPLAKCRKAFAQRFPSLFIMHATHPAWQELDLVSLSEVLQPVRSSSAFLFQAWSNLAFVCLLPEFAALWHAQLRMAAPFGGWCLRIMPDRQIRTSSETDIRAREGSRNRRLIVGLYPSSRSSYWLEHPMLFQMATLWAH